MKISILMHKKQEFVFWMNEYKSYGNGYYSNRLYPTGREFTNDINEARRFNSLYVILGKLGIDLKYKKINDFFIHNTLKHISDQKIRDIRLSIVLDEPIEYNKIFDTILADINRLAKIYKILKDGSVVRISDNDILEYLTNRYNQTN